MRTILHIDFDSFFASCEQQFNPQFRNKPLGVTARNGRTAIIAASREAKKRGVKSPSRTFEAQLICPELILTTAHFESYWEISKKFINLCKDYSPFVEIFSLDEVFMDVTKTAHLFGGVQPIIKAIRERIKKDIGEYITVSVGISHNKLLAKLASGLDKPNGMVEITRKNMTTVYKKAKLTDVCGIGERLKVRLNRMGIFKLNQLGEAPLYKLISEFGNVEGRILKEIGLGIDNERVIPYADPVKVKSVGRNYCLPRNEYDQRIVFQNLYELCEEIGIKLRRLGKKAKTIGLSLRGNSDIHGRKTFSEYINFGKDIFEACLWIVRHSGEVVSDDRLQNQKERFWTSSKGRPASGWSQNNNIYIRQISIWAANLEDSSNVSLSLFSNDVRLDKLHQTIDAINEKFGNHTIRNGFLLYTDKLTTEPNGYMADKYERTKLSKVISSTSEESLRCHLGGVLLSAKLT